MDSAENDLKKGLDSNIDSKERKFTFQGSYGKYF